MPKSENLSKKEKKYLLVRWIADETLSVLADSASRPGQKLYVGAEGSFKWAGKYYKGEVLGISGDYTSFAD